MTELEKAARQALEALESMKTYAESTEPGLIVGVPAIDALRRALEQQPQQEPVAAQQEQVAWPHKWGCRANAFGDCNMGCAVQQPTQAPLTDAQIGAVAADIWGSVLIAPQSYHAFARAIEQAHGIGETPDAA